MNEEHRDRILHMIVEEAIQKDKDKGMIIDNPSGYYNYKMERARHQAKEDSAWLMRQKDRLMGPVQAPLHMRLCARCDAALQPSVVYEYNGKDYCDIGCAEGTAVPITQREWMQELYRVKEKTGYRLTDSGERGEEFVITWEQAKRTNPKLAAEIEKNADVF